MLRCLIFFFVTTSTAHFIGNIWTTKSFDDNKSGYKSGEIASLFESFPNEPNPKDESDELNAPRDMLSELSGAKTTLLM